MLTLNQSKSFVLCIKHDFWFSSQQLTSFTSNPVSKTSAYAMQCKFQIRNTFSESKTQILNRKRSIVVHVLSGLMESVLNEQKVYSHRNGYRFYRPRFESNLGLTNDPIFSPLYNLTFTKH